MSDLNPSVAAEKKWDLLTFGETMLRLTPPGNGRLVEAVSLDVRIGGSESNTSVAFSRLGGKAAWWTRLPDNPLGHRIENEIRRWGVDVSGIVWEDSADSRAGLYFLDYGHAPRGIDVVYDRAESAASNISSDDVRIEDILQTRMLHITGITPALSSSCASAVEYAVQCANASNVIVSLDINYRSKLWSVEQARTTLESLLPRVQLLICSQEDAVSIFGTPQDGKAAAAEFWTRYGIETVVITCGGEGAAALSSDGKFEVHPLKLGHVVDRVGAGDAFDAGVIWGFMQNNLQLGLEYGMTMSALKHSIPGDMLISTKKEIDNLREGSALSINR